MTTEVLRRDYVGRLTMCSLALVTMPLMANLMNDDLAPHRTYFQGHVAWSLVLIAVPAALHLLVQLAICEGMRRSHNEGRLMSALRPACVFLVGFAAGLAETAVADLLFLASFP